ncbi:MAG: hypothetical protein GQ534_05315 [Candidatus Delongbacteria bacterium]|nr:hypothetical protein [Candidatus Delongbacteria bacterium]
MKKFLLRVLLSLLVVAFLVSCAKKEEAAAGVAEKVDVEKTDTVVEEAVEVVEEAVEVVEEVIEEIPVETPEPK